jgi:hypothetical protein
MASARTIKWGTVVNGDSTVSNMDAFVGDFRPLARRHLRGALRSTVFYHFIRGVWGIFSDSETLRLQATASDTAEGIRAADAVTALDNERLGVAAAPAIAMTSPASAR